MAPNCGFTFDVGDWHMAMATDEPLPTLPMQRVDENKPCQIAGLRFPSPFPYQTPLPSQTKEFPTETTKSHDLDQTVLFDMPKAPPSSLLVATRMSRATRPETSESKVCD